MKKTVTNIQNFFHFDTRTHIENHQTSISLKTWQTVSGQLFFATSVEFCGNYLPQGQMRVLLLTVDSRGSNETNVTLKSKNTNYIYFIK